MTSSPTVASFFTFSNPLFLDLTVAVGLFVVYKLLYKKLPKLALGISEASFIFLIFFFYDMSRFLSLDGSYVAIANARKVIDFEKLIGIDIEIPIQKLVVHAETFVKFLNNFYLGAHWGGVVIFFVWGYLRIGNVTRRRVEYLQARGRFVIMNLVAVSSFMAFPCAPPRAIPDGGYIDTLASVSHTDVYTSTRRWVNPYAAMPSMHIGYSLLFSFSVFLMLRSEILAPANEEVDDSKGGFCEISPKSNSCFAKLMNKYRNYRYKFLPETLPSIKNLSERKKFYLSFLPSLVLLYPCFMFLVVVATGNHFVLDAIAGAVAMCVGVLAYPICCLIWMEIVQQYRKIRERFGLTWPNARPDKMRDLEMGDLRDEDYDDETTDDSEKEDVDNLHLSGSVEKASLLESR